MEYINLILWPLKVTVKPILNQLWGKPMIEFKEPNIKDEQAFGRVWYISISNIPLKGLRSIFVTRKDIPRCQIIGVFSIGGNELTSHTWETNSSGRMIYLPSTGQPDTLDFIVKKQGYDWCGITSVPIEDSEKLPMNSSIDVRLKLIEGDSVLGYADYIIQNYGVNISDVHVRRK